MHCSLGGTNYVRYGLQALQSAQYARAGIDHDETQPHQHGLQDQQVIGTSFIAAPGSVSTSGWSYCDTASAQCALLSLTADLVTTCKAEVTL